LDEMSAEQVAECVADLASEHGQPRLIIIDTLARNFGVGDENSTSDMSRFIFAMDDLQARFPECTVLNVHHSGHGDKARARGAIALKGALDLEYRVEKTDSVIKLTNTKMKDAEAPPDQFFESVGVDLDDNASSAVLQTSKAPECTQKLSSTQKMGLEAYAKVTQTDAIWQNGEFKGVRLEKWREAFYPMQTADTAEAKRKAFVRVRKALVEKRLMAVLDDVYLNEDAIPVEQLFDQGGET
jgi:hypothetical protein